jgi:hypothetical protein
MLIASGVYIMAIDPFYHDIRIGLAKKDALEKSITDAASAKQKIEHLAAVESTFPADYLIKLRTLLPDTIDDTKLIIEVNKMAERNGLHIKTPQIGKGDASKKSALPYVKHTVTLTVHAPYAVFRKYLRDIEGNLSLRDVLSTSFTSQTSDEDALKYKDPNLIPHDYNLILVTYSLH